jgi:hypothetical protein
MVLSELALTSLWPSALMATDKTEHYGPSLGKSIFGVPECTSGRPACASRIAGYARGEECLKSDRDLLFSCIMRMRYSFFTDYLIFSTN